MSVRGYHQSGLDSRIDARIEYTPRAPRKNAASANNSWDQESATCYLLSATDDAPGSEDERSGVPSPGTRTALHQHYYSIAWHKSNWEDKYT